MRQFQGLRISEEIVLRQRCHAWKCKNPATHYAFDRWEYRGYHHCLGAYCQPHTPSMQGVVYPRIEFDKKAKKV